jgi:hypothetical protein
MEATQPNRMYCIVGRSYKLPSYTVVAHREHVARAKLNHQAGVAGAERSADREHGALLGLGMRRYGKLETHAGRGGTLGTHC